MKRRNIERIVLVVAMLLVVPVTLRSSDNSGINALIAVTQLKANNANDEALRGAERQRAVVKDLKNERERQRAFEVLQQLEAHARRTGEVLASINAVSEYIRAHPCK